MHMELPKLNIENPKFWVFLQGNPQAIHFIAQHLDGDLDLEHAEDLELYRSYGTNSPTNNKIF